MVSAADRHADALVLARRPVLRSAFGGSGDRQPRLRPGVKVLAEEPRRLRWPRTGLTQDVDEQAERRTMGIARVDEPSNGCVGEDDVPRDGRVRQRLMPDLPCRAALDALVM